MFEQIIKKLNIEISNTSYNLKDNLNKNALSEKLNNKYINLLYIKEILNEWINIYNNIIFLEKEIKNNSEIKNLAIEELYIYKKIKYDLLNKILIFICKENANIIGCFLEIRAGTGGNEASLFAEELFKMYYKYLNRYNYNLNIISKIINYNGGIKEIIVEIKDCYIYNKLKFESGGHRVQRIPETESKGRIHTSSCTVGVIPIYNINNNFDININDLKIYTFKSSGAGGQHVNTTNSAVRIVHIPTNISIECQDERSQHHNKKKAIEILKHKLKILKIEKERNKYSMLRKKILGTGNRNDRIRTYNYANNRITDHIYNIKYNQLYNIINNGKLDIIIESIIDNYINNSFINIINNYDKL